MSRGSSVPPRRTISSGGTATRQRACVTHASSIVAPAAPVRIIRTAWPGSTAIAPRPSTTRPLTGSRIVMRSPADHGSRGRDKRCVLQRSPELVPRLRGGRRPWRGPRGRAGGAGEQDRQREPATRRRARTDSRGEVMAPRGGWRSLVAARRQGPAPRGCALRRCGSRRPRRPRRRARRSRRARRAHTTCGHWRHAVAARTRAPASFVARNDDLGPRAARRAQSRERGGAVDAPFEDAARCAPGSAPRGRAQLLRPRERPPPQRLPGPCPSAPARRRRAPTGRARRCRS